MHLSILKKFFFMRGNIDAGALVIACALIVAGFLSALIKALQLAPRKSSRRARLFVFVMFLRLYCCARCAV